VTLHIDDVLVHRGSRRGSVAGFDEREDGLVLCDDALRSRDIGARLIGELLVRA
jgi:hypothetical protein